MDNQELIGYSNSLSFDDAFKHAIDQISEDPNEPTDMRIYVISEIGLERGGVVLMDRLFVKIKRKPLPKQA